MRADRNASAERQNEAFVRETPQMRADRNRTVERIESELVRETPQMRDGLRFDASAWDITCGPRWLR